MAPVLTRTQNAADESHGGLLLEPELLANAVAGIYKDGQAEGQVGFGGELLDDLRLLVFDDLEIVFPEIGDEPALLIRDREQDMLRA